MLSHPATGTPAALSAPLMRIAQVSLKAGRVFKSGQPLAVPASLQGVSKEKVRSLRQGLDLDGNADLIDGVFALLDDETES